MKPKHLRAASLRPSTYDEADNSIEVVWTTGAAVRRRDYLRDLVYDEILSLEPGAVRLDRLNAGAPLLDAHDDRSLAAVIGSVVPGSARIEGGVGLARVRLSTAASDADVVEKIRDGIIRNISVGYSIHEWHVSPGGEDVDEIRTAIEWEPLEISAVPIPADAGAHFRDLREDGSPAAAARARMNARARSVTGGEPGYRRATPIEVMESGRSPWLIPDDEWPFVEDRT